MMRIIIVDDDQLVALSLKTILETDKKIEIEAIGKSGEEAISLYQQLQPDVMLMDIRMDGLNGLDAGAVILQNYPNAKILFLTTFSDDEYIVKALRMGAKGYILKQNFESISPSLEAVYNGQIVFGADIVNKLPDMLQNKHVCDFKAFGLTAKEIELLRYVADGMNNKEIAAALFLSEGTVRNYLSLLLEKLDLRDRTQLAIFYYKHYQS